MQLRPPGYAAYFRLYSEPKVYTTYTACPQCARRAGVPVWNLKSEMTIRVFANTRYTQGEEPSLTAWAEDIRVRIRETLNAESFSVVFNEDEELVTRTQE